MTIAVLGLGGVTILVMLGEYLRGAALALYTWLNGAPDDRS